MRHCLRIRFDKHILFVQKCQIKIKSKLVQNVYYYSNDSFQFGLCEWARKTNLSVDCLKRIIKRMK